MRIKRILFLTAILYGAAAMADTTTSVTIDSGVLAGATHEGVNSFKGIPFAKPPLGQLRWKAPQVPELWKASRDATKYQLPCTQPTDADGKTPNGGGVWGETSEDCLYLNVSAPAQVKRAPVMVWLHGGASYLGGSHLGGYNGESFAKHGVITVTVNYRLGPLGYFSHPALTKAAGASEWLGNYGLMDAVAALQWVQRNIDKFGGDPKNVTLFGQSAGGAMVMSLLSVPAAKGLFAKAGVQSGASLRPGTSLADAEKSGIELATKVGLSGATATAEQLRGVPAEKFGVREIARVAVSPVDGRFRTQATVDAFAAGTAINVPLFIGSNNGEGGFDSARKVAAAMSVRAPAFLYQFAYVPEWRKPAQPQGAPHSAEIVYAFDSWKFSSAGDPRVNDSDRKVAKQVNACWVAFANANVSATELSCDGFRWPAYTAQKDEAAVFGATPMITKSATLKNGPPPGAPRGSMAPN